MPNFFLTLLCILSYTVSYAATPLEEKYPNEDDLIKYLQEDKVDGETGTIEIEPKVVTMNVPKGFQFLDYFKTEYYFKNYFDFDGETVNITQEGILIPSDVNVYVDIDYFYSVYFENDVHLGTNLNDSIKTGLINIYQSYFDDESIKLSWYSDPIASDSTFSLFLPFKIDRSEESELFEVIIISRGNSFIKIQSRTDLSNAPQMIAEKDQIINSFDFLQGSYDDSGNSYDNYLGYLRAERKREIMDQISNSHSHSSGGSGLPRGTFKIIALIILGIGALIRYVSKKSSDSSD